MTAKVDVDLVRIRLNVLQDLLADGYVEKVKYKNQTFIGTSPPNDLPSYAVQRMYKIGHSQNDLLHWYTVIKWCLCNRFKGRCSVCEVYGWPIVK